MSDIFVPQVLYHQIYWLFFWGFYMAPLFIFFPITDLLRDGNLKQSEHVKVLFKSPIMTLFFEWIGITKVYRYTTLIVPKLLVRFPKPRVIGSDSCSRFWLQNLGTLVQIWPWRFFSSDLSSDLALNCFLFKVCMLTSLTDSATEKLSKYNFSSKLNQKSEKSPNLIGQIFTCRRCCRERGDFLLFSRVRWRS